MCKLIGNNWIAIDVSAIMAGRPGGAGAAAAGRREVR
jgi:hypothetical protein